MHIASPNCGRKVLRNVVSNSGSSPAFELTVTASSTTASVTAVTINSVSSTNQAPSNPSEPSALETLQRARV